MALHIGKHMKTCRYSCRQTAKWEEIDTQALLMILMNIVPNVQAGIDCLSVKAAWDGLTN